MVQEFAWCFPQSATHIQVPYKKQLEWLHMACLGVHRTMLISLISEPLGAFNCSTF